MNGDAQKLLDRLDRRNPFALKLARLASVAVQVEPELLRALRLTIADADAGAEADVWLSDLVESRSALAITLRRDVRTLLHQQLDKASLDTVEAVLTRVHAQVSYVVGIEEKVTLASLAGKPKDDIDRLLAPIVATMESQPQRGLARWAVRAFHAAPEAAQETESMWRLMRCSSVARASSTTAPVEVALASLPRRTVRLRLRRDLLEIDGTLKSTNGVAIEVPDTNPLMLEIAWRDGERRSRRVTFREGETVRVTLRPRDVTVSTFNGETYAIAPELELEDYAIVMGTAHSADSFREWLVAKDGGRVPEDAVHQVDHHDDWQKALAVMPRLRRAYLYFAGIAIGFPDGFSLLLEDGTSVDSETLRRQLGEHAEEVVIVVESKWGQSTMPSANFWDALVPVKEMIVLNDLDQGAITPTLIDGLSGRAANDEGKVTTRSLSAYIQRSSMRWRISHDFVLCGAVETVATFALPRILIGTEMVIDSQLFHTGEQVAVPIRPGKHELAFPKQHYFRNLTIRPGHNDIDLRWRWNGKWVIVAGTGTRQLRPEERLLCETVARMLADHGFGLFVGSWRGVDELAAQVFTERVEMLEGGATEVFRQYVHHRSEPQFKAARTVVVEDDYDAPLDEAAALIAIGGAEGTYEYAKRAERRQVRVFPIAATGGAAAALAEGVEGEFHIDEVTARDIVLHIIDQL